MLEVSKAAFQRATLNEFFNIEIELVGKCTQGSSIRRAGSINVAKVFALGRRTENHAVIVITAGDASAGCGPIIPSL